MKRSNLLINLIKKHLGLVLFLIMGTIALFTFDDYGISWDEMIQRKTGLINYNYIFSGDEQLLKWKDKDYGVAFELPLIIIEKTLNLTDSRDIYLSRHLLTHLFFLLGAFFIFRLVKLLYQSNLLATIAFLMIVLHPRLYAHSFFNTKDIPFLAMFIISFYYMAVAFKNKTLLNFLIFGASIGVLINLRIMGVLLPSAALLFLSIDAIKKKEYFLNLKLAATFLITAIALLILTWPFLWSDPYNNFIAAFKSMSSFRWGSSVLFNGHFIKGEKIFWYYIPAWFNLTTPIIFLLAGFSASILFIIKFIKGPLQFITNTMDRNNALYFACFYLPILAVILLHSTLYDGWRQMFFIYPSFVLIAIYGMNYLIQENKKQIVVILASLAFVSVSIFMIRNAPFQQVYFNQLMSYGDDESIRQNFEFDYWGASYKQVYEYILENDDDEIIYICSANKPGVNTLSILKPEERNRIKLVELNEASYFITNFRYHPKGYEDLEGLEYHSFKVGNNTVNQIYKLD